MLNYSFYEIECFSHQNSWGKTSLLEQVAKTKGKSLTPRGMPTDRENMWDQRHLQGTKGGC